MYPSGSSPERAFGLLLEVAAPSLASGLKADPSLSAEIFVHSQESTTWNRINQNFPLQNLSSLRGTPFEEGGEGDVNKEIDGGLCLRFRFGVRLQLRRLEDGRASGKQNTKGAEEAAGWLFGFEDGREREKVGEGAGESGQIGGQGNCALRAAVGIAEASSDNLEISCASSSGDPTVLSLPLESRGFQPHTDTHPTATLSPAAPSPVQSPFQLQTHQTPPGHSPIPQMSSHEGQGDGQGLLWGGGSGKVDGEGRKLSTPTDVPSSTDVSPSPYRTLPPPFSPTGAPWGGNTGRVIQQSPVSSVRQTAERGGSFSCGEIREVTRCGVVRVTVRMVPLEKTKAEEAEPPVILKQIGDKNGGMITTGLTTSGRVATAAHAPFFSRHSPKSTPDTVDASLADDLSIAYKQFEAEKEDEEMEDRDKDEEEENIPKSPPHTGVPLDISGDTNNVLSQSAPAASLPFLPLRRSSEHSPLTRNPLLSPLNVNTRDERKQSPDSPLHTFLCKLEEGIIDGPESPVDHKRGAGLFLLPNRHSSTMSPSPLAALTRRPSLPSPVRPALMPLASFPPLPLTALPPSPVKEEAGEEGEGLFSSKKLMASSVGLMEGSDRQIKPGEPSCGLPMPSASFVLSQERGAGGDSHCKEGEENDETEENGQGQRGGKNEEEEFEGEKEATKSLASTHYRKWLSQNCCSRPVLAHSASLSVQPQCQPSALSHGMQQAGEATPTPLAGLYPETHINFPTGPVIPAPFMEAEKDKEQGNVPEGTGAGGGGATLAVSQSKRRSESLSGCFGGFKTFVSLARQGGSFSGDGPPVGGCAPDSEVAEGGGGTMAGHAEGAAVEGEERNVTEGQGEGKFGVASALLSPSRVLGHSSAGRPDDSIADSKEVLRQKGAHGDRQRRASESIGRFRQSPSLTYMGKREATETADKEHDGHVVVTIPPATAEGV
uniref:Uncharacterized protein n=1 Tax=Chromera velia CCMP2878 TaxID=1169474 RepID=A0A0G4FW98_9ALVE|eukprot:Cvel_484.t1-p1 / transcript=Cvel_484.t1 / gene=Cvel_484 / organism=Chromera_velia_CCMP2878 / gene_product=hypothetical protein / transcript_product=hypothetical protein / location=Cvel_scaffold15:89113-94298(+) / protein_length=941 / sequence_SO=supercontig / SO=protein_coding / is_pseudo=false